MTKIRKRLSPFLKSPAYGYALSAVKQAAAVGTGFLFAFSGRGFTLSPLGVAAVCASAEKYRISVSIGSSLGYIMYCDSLSALRYIAAVLCAFVLSKLLSSFDYAVTPPFLAGVAAFCIFSTGLALGFAEGLGFRLFTSSMTEAVYAFCSGFVLRLAVSRFEIKPTLKNMSLGEFILASFVLSLFLWSLGGTGFALFNPINVIIFYLLLTLPELYSSLGSVIFGVCVFTVFSAFSEGTRVPLSFILGAFSCSVSFLSSRKIRLRAAFFLSSTLLVYLISSPFEGSFIFESVTAALLFCLTPQKYQKSFVNYLSGSSEPIYNNSFGNGLSAQLHLASTAVEEISTAVTAVSSTLDRGLPSARNEVFSLVTGELCSSCVNYEKCWQREREKTVEFFDGLLERLEKNEFIDFQNLSVEAKARCIKGVQLASSFNSGFCNYTVESLRLKEKNEMRRTVAEQFSSVSDIIDDIAVGFEKNGFPDEALSEKVRYVCFSFGLKPERAVCKIGRNGRLTIEIECKEIPKEFTGTLFRERLEDVCSKRLEQPVIIGGEESELITVCEKYPLAVEVGTSQITSKGERLCGDSVEHFYDGRGTFDVVLADGMGTGPRAALDSSMARGLTGTLLKKGISPTGTLKLVNSALMVKSTDESLSSLDIMQVDMFSGKTEFFKAGAASSFVRHKGRVQEIKKPALPLGILHKVEFGSMKGSVSGGDIAVMVSDGIADCGTETVREIIRKNAALSSDELASLLTKTAEKLAGEKHDDLTAVVCKFH